MAKTSDPLITSPGRGSLQPQSTSCLFSPVTQTAFMGFVFFFTFSAYDTVQAYAKKVYPKDLGTNMVMCIYILFTVCSFVAPPIVNKIGSRTSMFFGIIGYSTVVIAGLVFFENQSASYMPNIVLASGGVLGVGASLLWTGQGRLILDYANDDNRGKLFGIFWAMYRGASIQGGLLAFFYFSIRGDDSGSIMLYIIFLVLIGIGAFLTLFLKHPEEVYNSSAFQSRTQRQGTPEKTGSWWQEAKATLAMFVEKEMLCLTLMFWASGSNEPYILNTFTRYFDKTATGMELVFYFTASACGAIACGNMLDYLSKINKQRSGAILILAGFTIIHCGGFAIALIVELNNWQTNLKLNDKNIILPSVAFTLWGLSDSMINTFLYWMIGILYSDGNRKTRAIGYFKMLNSAAHIFGYAVAPLHRMDGWMQLSCNIGFYMIGIITTIPALPKG